jgi:hypothetical protein
MQEGAGVGKVVEVTRRDQKERGRGGAREGGGDCEWRPLAIFTERGGRYDKPVCERTK